MNIPGYSSIHSFAANNLFNTPAKQTVGRILAGTGAVATVTLGYLKAGFPEAVISAALNTGTTCFKSVATNVNITDATMAAVESGCKSSVGTLAIETLKATAIIGLTVFCAVKALKAGNNSEKLKEV